MSAADAAPDQVLSKLSLAFIRNLASLSATSVLYGIYMITFSIAFISLVRRRGELASILLALATVIMFGISTFFWASNISVFVEELQTIMGKTYADLPTRIRDSNAKTQTVRYLGDTLFAFSYIIGDAVMAWRILIITRWKLLPTVVLVGLWLGTTAMGLGLFGCVIYENWDPNLPPWCMQMGNVAWLLSLAFNGLATALLARIAWTHGKATKMISSSTKKTTATRVLEIMVISGVIYFLLGVPRLTAFAKLSLTPFTTRLTVATQIIEGMLGQLVGLYPTAVTTFLLYESKVFGGHTTAGPGSSNTRPTFLFARDASRKTTDFEESSGITMVALGKREHLSTEDVYAEQV